MLHVEYLDCEFNGPLKRDVSVFWRKDYLKFVINVQNRDCNDREINKNFLNLSLRENNGLIYDSNRYEVLPVTGEEDIPPFFSKYLEIASATDKYAVSQNEAPFGMSQEVVIFDADNKSEDKFPSHQLVANVASSTAYPNNIYSQLISSFK